MELTTVQSRVIGFTHSFESPVGTLHCAVDKVGRIIFLGFRPPRSNDALELRENKYACGELEFQLDQYFSGERDSFSLEVRMDGTGFQKAVWSHLMKIPFGQTVSYGEIALKIGRRDAARAVGNAVAANPVAIVVPCHRVLPVHGGIGNYALRGIEAEFGRRIKHDLLEIEGYYRRISSSRASA
jgi:methylated-DNA-[protein]-cysteine S-methyltransferase